MGSYDRQGDGDVDPGGRGHTLDQNDKLLEEVLRLRQEVTALRAKEQERQVRRQKQNSRYLRQLRDLSSFKLNISAEPPCRMTIPRGYRPVIDSVLMRCRIVL